MNKQEALKEYKNQEERLVLAKVLDKINFTENRNKLEYTDFLNLYEQELITKFLNKIHYTNYYFYGGFENAERKIAIFYPERFTKEMIEKNYNKMISIIRIKLPNDLIGKYDHREYLGAVMKIGIVREKIGDIMCNQNGADIIIREDAKKFIFQNIGSLTRFEKSEITEEPIENLKEVNVPKEEIDITVTSLRLDNFVGELARCSRNKATEIIDQERVLVNYQIETKVSKQIKEGDTITIRGKGRFIIKQLKGNTRKGRFIVLVEKFGKVTE